MAQRHAHRKGNHVRTGLRPSSVHQLREPRTIKPSARELFPELRRRLLDSRPVLVAAETTKVKHPGGWTQTVQHPPVFGAPMFRNVIDPETGAHI